MEKAIKKKMAERFMRPKTYDENTIPGLSPKMSNDPEDKSRKSSSVEGSPTQTGKIKKTKTMKHQFESAIVGSVLQRKQSVI